MTDEDEKTLAEEMRDMAELWSRDGNPTVSAYTAATLARKWAINLDERYVELPCDADGRPWHVGDRCVAHDRLTCDLWCGKIIELQLCENGGLIARVLLDKRPQAVRFNMRDITRPCAPADRLRSWVEGARNDEHMDLRELDRIADAMDGGED